MSMVAVGLPDKFSCRVGDTVTIIGADRKNFIGAEEFAQNCETVHYEALTCINPLIKRMVV